MDILVIDREALTNQLMTSRLEAKGHRITVETNKNAAFDMIRDKGFDCIMVDPAPLAEARPVIIGIWKNIRQQVRPYIMLLSKTATAEEAVLAGTNDVLMKPLNAQELEEKIGNAARLQDITRKLMIEENVHSSGGMVGKAAFLQLFLSATDRAFRYAERSLIVFITITNYEELLDDASVAELDDTVAKLSQQMTFMRRQSDVIGRVGQREFAVLLQRPQYETEAIDAINRFAEVLDKFCAGFENKALMPKLQLKLIELPQGAKLAERTAPLAADAAALA